MSPAFESNEYARGFATHRRLSPAALRRTVAFLSSALPHGGLNCRVLDACAGAGRFTELLQQALPSAEIHAIDQAPVMVDHFRQQTRLRSVSVDVSRLEDHHLHGQKYDLVTVSSAIHFFSLEAFFTAVAPLLGRDARLLVRTATREDLANCSPVGPIGKANELEISRAHSFAALIDSARTLAGFHLLRSDSTVSRRVLSEHRYRQFLNSRPKSILFSMEPGEIDEALSAMASAKRFVLTSRNTLFLFSKASDAPH